MTESLDGHLPTGPALLFASGRRFDPEDITDLGPVPHQLPGRGLAPAAGCAGRIVGLCSPPARSSPGSPPVTAPSSHTLPHGVMPEAAVTNLVLLLAQAGAANVPTRYSPTWACSASGRPARPSQELCHAHRRHRCGTGADPDRRPSRIRAHHAGRPVCGRRPRPLKPGWLPPTSWPPPFPDRGRAEASGRPAGTRRADT